MPYTHDTEPSGSYTQDSESSSDLTWAQAIRTWAAAIFTWASGGATYTADSEPSPTYTNDTEPTSCILSRTNLVYNPSFENNVSDNTALENNLTGGTATLSLDPTTGYSGSCSAKVIITSPAESDEWRVKLLINNTNPISLINGVTYTASIYAKSSDSRDIKFEMEGSTDYYSGNFTTTTSWARYSLTFAASTTSTVKFNMLCNIPGTSGSLWFDAALVEVAGSAGTYFDGQTDDTQYKQFAWTGTTHNSTSTESNC